MMVRLRIAGLSASWHIEKASRAAMILDNDPMVQFLFQALLRYPYATHTIHVAK